MAGATFIMDRFHCLFLSPHSHGAAFTVSRWNLRHTRMWGRSRECSRTGRVGLFQHVCRNVPHSQSSRTQWLITVTALMLLRIQTQWLSNVPQSIAASTSFHVNEQGTHENSPGRGAEVEGGGRGDQTWKKKREKRIVSGENFLFRKLSFLHAARLHIGQPVRNQVTQEMQRVSAAMTRSQPARRSQILPARRAARKYLSPCRALEPWTLMLCWQRGRKQCRTKVKNIRVTVVGDGDQDGRISLLGYFIHLLHHMDSTCFALGPDIINVYWRFRRHTFAFRLLERLRLNKQFRFSACNVYGRAGPSVCLYLHLLAAVKGHRVNKLMNWRTDLVLILLWGHVSQFRDAGHD